MIYAQRYSFYFCITLAGVAIAMFAGASYAWALEPFETPAIHATTPLTPFTTSVPTSVNPADYSLGTPVAPTIQATGVMPTGGLVATNCMPPGPRTFFNPGGMDGMPCATVGLSAGLSVTGVCYAGQCRAAGFTPAGSVFNKFINSALSGVAQQFIGGLFGGGGSGYYTEPYTDPTSTSTLDINFDDLSTSTADTGYSFVFNENDNRTSLVYDPVTPVVTTINTPTVQPVTITQQLYNTQAPSTGGVATIPGEDRFTQDLLGITFDTNSEETTGGTLSLDDLERAAYEARMREAALQAQGDDVSGLGDYRSSSLSQRQTSGTPNDEATEKRPWWVTVVEFVGSLFGIAR